MTENPSPPLDLFDPQYRIDPAPLFHRMRAECPVLPMPMLGGFVLTRYHDIAGVLKDPRIGSANLTMLLDMLPPEAQQQVRPLRNSITRWMGHTQLEDHLRFQKLLKRYFTPQNVELMRPQIQQACDRLLDQTAGQARIEVMEELAYPLSATVMANLLGVPLEEWRTLKRWSNDLNVIFQTFDLDQLLQSQKSALEMEEYMRPIVAERRRNRQNDLVSVFVNAQEEGSIHSEEEILSNCVLLLFAGHDTTASLIGHGMRMLLTHPTELAKLRAHPELMPSAIEEMLRFDGPAQLSVRIPQEDVVVGGQLIPAKQRIFLALHAANRDPAVFPDPDRFDIERKDNRHLGFGFGLFYCLGASLARLQASVCFSALLQRLPNMRLSDIEPSWNFQPPILRLLSKYYIEC